MSGEFVGVQVLLLDACCAINLYASRHITNIVQSLPVRVAIARPVLEDEVLYVHWLREDGTLDKLPVVLRPLVASGLILVMDVDTAEEQASVVNFAALRFDDGEAVSAALAFHRGAAIATDDKRIVRVLREQFPQIPVLATSVLLRHWAEENNIAAPELQIVLGDIEVGGRFVPRSDDVHYQWWQTARNHSGATS